MDSRRCSRIYPTLRHRLTRITRCRTVSLFCFALFRFRCSIGVQAWARSPEAASQARNAVTGREVLHDASRISPTPWESSESRQRKMMESIIPLKRLNSAILEWPEITLELSRCELAVFPGYFSRVEAKGMCLEPWASLSCGLVSTCRITYAILLYVAWRSSLSVCKRGATNPTSNRILRPDHSCISYYLTIFPLLHIVSHDKIIALLLYSCTFILRLRDIKLARRKVRARRFVAQFHVSVDSRRSTFTTFQNALHFAFLFFFLFNAQLKLISRI